MNKKILIVDDSLFMRMMLKDILTNEGFEIAGEAANGEDAVVKYTATKPDLVIMDLIMPDIDGITALERIKKSDPDAKVIICSSMRREDIVTEAIAKGANAYIIKPFRSDIVINTIKKFIN